MTADDQKQYRRGLAYVGISALLWSLSGLFMRAISADLPTIIFWRGIVSGSAILLIFFYLERGKSYRILLAMRWPTLAATVLSALSMMAGLGSLYYTSIADSMVIYGTVPFVTAGVAFIFIGEKPSGSTLIASAVAFAGVLFMVMDAPAGGGLLGKGLAVIMTLTVAGLATVMRHHREVKMLPAMAASAWLCSLVTVWFASPLSVSTADIGLIVMFGLVQNAGGLVLYTFGSKRISAGAASLLTALEVPLTPIWVWIFMNEVPSHATLIGGPIVLLALFGHIVIEVRRTRIPALAPL
jgi:drug/metabolite transporter (DMT)-like permease